MSTSASVACNSLGVRPGGLSLMPSLASVSESLTLPSSMAIPNSALSRLLRTEATSVLRCVSPHSAITRPCWTIMTALEPLAAA